MNRMPWCSVFLVAVLLARASGAAVQRDPHIGYVYPAGGQQGTQFEVVVGGQFLDRITQVYISGEGVAAEFVSHDKPLTPKQQNVLRQKVQEVRKQMKEERKGSRPGTPRGGRRRRGHEDDRRFMEIAKEHGLSDADLEKLKELRKQRADPKRQANAQIAEKVTLKITFDPDAPPGERQLRLKTAAGITNPLALHVGRLPEFRESEPNDETAESAINGPLPVVLNGQILPGDVDRFRLKARRGEHLVIAVAARALIPYLADAVPGWFQATLALYDAGGNEVAYADDYQSDPDPVLACKIPKNGIYTVEIRDAIYRGREDFVYRITVGELSFVTSIFPLGGRAGNPATVDVSGWNLPVRRATIDVSKKPPGVHSVAVLADQPLINRVPFAIGSLPEGFEEEPNDDQSSAQPIRCPIVVNGRMDRPGDWDVFRFHGSEGTDLVVEVQARRLRSPLDSLVKLTDAEGQQLAANDDHEDKVEGLATYDADSQLRITLPADGTYYVHVGDTQHRGGPACAYRLRIGSRQPDFELRVVPSAINVRAGATEPITVYALRRDGFDHDIRLRLTDAPDGFQLSGAWVPAGQSSVRLTLTVPRDLDDQPIRLGLEGTAMIGREEVCRRAVPSDDMTQAFIYHHLVPANDWIVVRTGGKPVRASPKRIGKGPMRLPVGGTARVRFAVPRRPLLNQVELELTDPPAGITLEKMTPDRGGVAILFRADADKVEPGLKGNLIVDVFIERTARRKGAKSGGKKRRIPLFTLPAIPFEVVGP